MAQDKSAQKERSNKMIGRLIVQFNRESCARSTPGPSQGPSPPSRMESAASRTEKQLASGCFQLFWRCAELGLGRLVPVRIRRCDLLGRLGSLVILWTLRRSDIGPVGFRHHSARRLLPPSSATCLCHSHILHPAQRNRTTNIATCPSHPSPTLSASAALPATEECLGNGYAGVDCPYGPASRG
jgi:hypothetical protein